MTSVTTGFALIGDRLQTGGPVVSKCANPDCGKRFVYFRGGSLFTLERTEAGQEHTEVEWFWLCEACATRVDLLVALAKERGAQIRRSPQALVLERLTG